MPHAGLVADPAAAPQTAPPLPAAAAPHVAPEGEPAPPGLAPQLPPAAGDPPQVGPPVIFGDAAFQPAAGDVLAAAAQPGAAGDAEVVVPLMPLG